VKSIFGIFLLLAAAGVWPVPKVKTPAKAPVLKPVLRQVQWGMTIDEVKATEGKTTFLSQDTIDPSLTRISFAVQYEISGGRKPDATLCYYFKGGKLSMATYQLPPEAAFAYDQLPQYIKLYELLKAQMSSLWGRSGDEIGTSSLEKLGIDPPAIDRVGVWETSRSKIFLVMLEGKVKLIYQTK
jgi:hypothetical protein